MKNSLSYSIRTRKTQKGFVYDAIFRIDNEDGKTIQKCLSGYHTKTAAKDAYIEFMRSYIDPSNRKQSAIYYDAAMKQYLDFLAQTTKESTQYDFTHIKQKYFDLYFNGNMRDWTKQDIYFFIDKLWSSTHDGKQYKQKYLTKVYRFFTTFYRWARDRYDLEDILRGIKLPKKPEQKFEYKIWTQEDFNQFIQFVDNEKYKTLFSTLFYSGLRCGELQALKVKDFNGSSLYVNKTYSRKTMDDSAFKITDSKNYKSRYVPLPKNIIELLNNFMGNKSKDEFIFGSNDPISSNAISTAFNKYISLSNVTKIRIHDLRHSYVSLLMSKGANFGIIASLIGDTLEQVVKTYAHTTEEDKLHIISLL